MPRSEDTKFKLLDFPKNPSRKETCNEKFDMQPLHVFKDSSLSLAPHLPRRTSKGLKEMHGEHRTIASKESESNL